MGMGMACMLDVLRWAPCPATGGHHLVHTVPAHTVMQLRKQNKTHLSPTAQATGLHHGICPSAFTAWPVWCVRPSPVTRSCRMYLVCWNESCKAARTVVHADCINQIPLARQCTASQTMTMTMQSSANLRSVPTWRQPVYSALRHRPS